MAKGQTTLEVVRKLGITEQTFCWNLQALLGSTFSLKSPEPS